MKLCKAIKNKMGKCHIRGTQPLLHEMRVLTQNLILSRHVTYAILAVSPQQHQKALRSSKPLLAGKRNGYAIQPKNAPVPALL